MIWHIDRILPVPFQEQKSYISCAAHIHCVDSGKAFSAFQAASGLLLPIRVALFPPSQWTYLGLKVGHLHRAVHRVRGPVLAGGA